MRRRKTSIVVTLVMILIVALPTVAYALPPGPPKGFHKVGEVADPECMSLRSFRDRLIICPLDALGPRVKIKYRGTDTGWRWKSKYVYYSGQGGGGYVTDNAYVRFYPYSGDIGEVAVYAAETWHQ